MPHTDRNRLMVPVYNGKRFTWTNGVGAVEMSDLNRQGVASRVWNDACDIGFEVLSERTGRQVLFTLEKEERDAEGELTCEVYASYGLRELIRIKVFND